MTTSDRPTSTPSAAKVATAKGAAVGNVISMITELVACIVAAWLCSIGKLTSVETIGVIAFALGGPVISKARGKPPQSSLIGVIAFLPAVKAVILKTPFI